jgi:DNA invertase Pin-like site-specific DNA recombinase
MTHRRCHVAAQSSHRVAIYARVSTINHGQDVGMQTRDLEQFAQVRGWTLADSYIDVGISGAKHRRPELDRLMRDAHARKFDVVVVWKFDRFARSVSHLLRALETFNALGIAFVSLSEQMDTTTPAGKMVFIVLGAVAELERSLIVERVRAGMRNARAKGRLIGRRPRRQLTPDDRKSIAEEYWRKKGSFRQLAKRFDTSIGTVQRCALAYQRVFAIAPKTL